jgi:hypothetical protein
MSNTIGAMPFSSIPGCVGYLNDRGCDVIQILNPEGYWQTIVYNEPKNFIDWFNAAAKSENNAIHNMIVATDKVIKTLDLAASAIKICYEGT